MTSSEHRPPVAGNTFARSIVGVNLTLLAVNDEPLPFVGNLWQNKEVYRRSECPGGRVVIGRGPMHVARDSLAAERGNIFSIGCPVMSRKHCILSIGSDEVTAVDAPSHHGVYLEDPESGRLNKIGAQQPRALSDGAVLILGRPVTKDSETHSPARVQVNFVYQGVPYIPTSYGLEDKRYATNGSNKYGLDPSDPDEYDGEFDSDLDNELFAVNTEPIPGLDAAPWRKLSISEITIPNDTNRAGSSSGRAQPGPSSVLSGSRTSVVDLHAERPAQTPDQSHLPIETRYTSVTSDRQYQYVPPGGDDALFEELYSFDSPKSQQSRHLPGAFQNSFRESSQILWSGPAVDAPESVRNAVSPDVSGPPGSEIFERSGEHSIIDTTSLAHDEAADSDRDMDLSEDEHSAWEFAHGASVNGEGQGPVASPTPVPVILPTAIVETEVRVDGPDPELLDATSRPTQAASPAPAESSSRKRLHEELEELGDRENNIRLGEGDLPRQSVPRTEPDLEIPSLADTTAIEPPAKRRRPNNSVGLVKGMIAGAIAGSAFTWAGLAYF